MDDLTAFERQLSGEIAGLMGPVRPVDDLAIYESVTAASRSHRWGFTLFSALKFIAASVIVALFGGFLMVGVFTTQQGDEVSPAAPSASLAPTGIDILTPSSGATTELVADGDGVLWALEVPGRLVRFDPDTDTTTMWTIADDVAFGQVASIAPSPRGGVWLAGPDAVRLFDGDRFVQLIEAPEALKLAVEAADESLWAATQSGIVLHWDGSGWEDVGPASPGACDWIGALAVDSTGRPWVGGKRWSSCEGAAGVEVMVLDGSEWTRFDRSDASPLEKWPQSIMGMPDGSVWVASEAGLARFDGTGWTDGSPEPGGSYGSLAASPEGTIWAGSDERGGARVWRWDGAEWTKFARAELDPHGYAKVAIVGDQVFLGTTAGTYERIADSWNLSWDVTPARPGLSRLLATGDDELWVVDAQGVRHVEDGAWADELDWTTQAADSVFLWSDLALGPDGTVWVAGPDGVAYRDGEQWEFIDSRPTGAITVDATGTVWVARSQARRSGGCQVWTLEKGGDGAWARGDVDGCPLKYALQSLAVDGDGTLWLGVQGGWGPGGLVRHANGEWAAIEEIGDTEVYGGIVLGTDSEGAVWVLSQQNIGSKNAEQVASGPMARFDGGDVSIVELPEGATPAGVSWQEGLLAPDGMPWAATERGPARFDGQTWRFPYGDAAIPWMQVGAVAPDGSFYGVVAGDAIVRYPSPSEWIGGSPQQLEPG